MHKLLRFDIIIKIPFSILSTPNDHENRKQSRNIKRGGSERSLNDQFLTSTEKSPKLKSSFRSTSAKRFDFMELIIIVWMHFDVILK